MKKMSENNTFKQAVSEINDKTVTRKNYTKPELTHYGDISSLVKAQVVTQADGGAPPFQAQS